MIWLWSMLLPILAVASLMGGIWAFGSQDRWRALGLVPWVLLLAYVIAVGTSA